MSRPRKNTPPEVGRSERHDVSPPLHSIPHVPLPPGDLRVIPRHPLPTRSTGRQARGLDPAAQTTFGAQAVAAPVAAMPATSVNFEGMNEGDNGHGVLPPDPNGDVGLNHYVQIVNTLFAVYDKSGTRLYGPATINTLWSGFGGPCETTNQGDPVALYDHLADRWLLTQFAHSLNPFGTPLGPFYQCIAISQTGDPTGAYYRYAFVVSSNKLNDYAKLVVWPDGYYMSANQFQCNLLGCSWGGQGAWAFERTRMLSGQPAAMVSFDLFAANSNFGGLLPSDLDGPPPPAGTPNSFVEVKDSADGWPTDQLHVFQFHVNWATPSASTFTGPDVLNTSPFDSKLCGGNDACIPEQGTAQRLDVIADRLMYRLQYRNFGDHETLMLNHTVAVGDFADHAGIRWYELRRGGAWSIYQQGTYAPDAHHRWMGSIAMDGAGNVAVGYSTSSSTLYPSIRYAGRLASDPLGTLPQAEGILMAGGGAQLNSSGRWGDYTMLAVDPADDCTFWYTNEYFAQTFDNFWQTRVGAFRFPGCGGPLPTPTSGPSPTAR